MMLKLTEFFVMKTLIHLKNSWVYLLHLWSYEVPKMFLKTLQTELMYEVLSTTKNQKKSELRGGGFQSPYSAPCCVDAGNKTRRLAR